MTGKGLVAAQETELPPPLHGHVHARAHARTVSYMYGYKILSQDLGLVPGFHGDSCDRKTDADRALVWLPRATGMVQIYRAVPTLWT